MDRHNHSETLIIVLHEIYGVNKHIENAAAHFRKAGFSVLCPDFSGQRVPFVYAAQESAYKHFISEAGFEKGVLTVEKLLPEAKQKYRKVFLCGYSAGATVAWLCSGNPALDGIIGFYGSRIRDHFHISPRCPALLLFPEFEKSFDAAELAASLDKPGVEVHILEGGHGFADPFSPNYHEDSFIKASRLVDEFLSKNL